MHSMLDAGSSYVWIAAGGQLTLKEAGKLAPAFGCFFGCFLIGLHVDGSRLSREPVKQKI
jgi:hypothetical protein